MTPNKNLTIFLWFSLLSLLYLEGNGQPHFGTKFICGSQKYKIVALDALGNTALCSLYSKGDNQHFEYYPDNKEILYQRIVKNQGLKNSIVDSLDISKLTKIDSKLTFENCYIFRIYNSEEVDTLHAEFAFQNITIDFIDLQKTTFIKKVSFSDLCNSNLTLKSNRFSQLFFHKTKNLNWKLHNNFFADVLWIDDITFNQLMSFWGSSFYGTLRLTEIHFIPTFDSTKPEHTKTLDSSNFLKGCYFDKLSIITLNNLSLENIKIDLEEIPRTKFIVYGTDRIEDKTKFFNSGIKYINQDVFNSGDVKQEAVDKLKHEKFKIELSSMSLFREPGNYLWNTGALLFVNAGYKGIKLFFGVSIITILLFAFIFKFNKSSKEIYALVHNKDFLNKDLFSKAVTSWNKKPLWSFSMCFWFSTKIYFSPIIQPSVFYSSKNLRFWILVEYIFGLYMLILFLIYLAPTFAFFKALL